MTNEEDLYKNFTPEGRLDKNEPEYKKTLRDEFAMAALNGFSIGVDTEFYPTYAGIIYQIADAMLEARKAKGE